MIASRNRHKNHPRQPSTRVSAVLIPMISAAGLALLLSATATLATPLTINGMNELGSVEFDFPARSKDIFLRGFDSVTLHSNYDDFGARNTVWAGAFGGEAQRVVDVSGNPDPFDPKTLYRSQDEVILYCLDIFNDLEYANGFVEYVAYEFDDAADEDPTTATKVSENLSITGNLNNVLNFLGALNKELAETEYWVKEDDGDDGWVQYGTYNFGDRNWLNPANSIMSGAIQVGIWESLYDDDMNINSGHFSVTGLDYDGEALLTEAFGRMESSDPLDSSQVLLFQPVTGGQTLIGDPVKVPAPGTLALLLSGLFLVRKVRRGSR
jgi:hypothetical protein